MQKSAREVLEQAQNEGWAIGAFNAANIETLRAIVAAASKLRSPVIVESSSGETKFFGAENLVDVVKNFREELNLPIFINLDHSPSEEEIKVGLDAGYELLHFDGGKLPFEENVEKTKRIVEQAHAKGLLVEGEIDHIGGSSAPHLGESAESAQKSTTYTDPDKAAEFCKETGVDTFAAFFGNVHGVYKEPPKLDLERLKKIREKVDCFLSMHGGSGIKDEDVREAIKVGRIAKINVNTEMRVAFREALEHDLKKTDEVAIYKIMPPVIEAVQKVVEEKIKVFGSEGKA
ncbi:ketose-bisphosphate aldolase [Candidatus Woesebacteria bacterium]|nr:ketose-bisphosphate aldolase [Candidatus Woesebacteria bacterium]